MIMADVLFYFLLVVGFYVIFIGYWLATVALFPRLVEACRQRYENSTIISTLIGFAAGLPPAVTGLILAGQNGHPLLQLVGLAIVFTLIFLGLMGSSGLCAQIGRGLPSPIDEAQPWRRVLRGGIILGLTFLLPVAGWFAVLPLALISGIGVAVRSLLAVWRDQWKSMGRRSIVVEHHSHTMPGVGIPQVRP
ncbi:MAG TPA: hypothetical protein VK970_09425 [Candidatus Methylacidiphilales bacterium]|nr:hypothetical protein [Candidatus Methylacidiphilales bacterium]